MTAPAAGRTVETVVEERRAGGDTPVVGIVIVSHQTRDATLRCVESVGLHGEVPGYDVRVAVVDNASTDGTVEAVREAFGEPVEVIASRANLGYGAACNRGAAHFDGADFLLFLNADVAIGPHAVERLVEALGCAPGAAIAGPRVTFPDGTPQPSVRGDPTPLALLHQHTALRYLRVGAEAYRRYKQPRAGGSMEDAPASVVLGACMLVRGTSFRALGGFDERYFLYFEEADLCRRARAVEASLDDELRGQVLYVPSATVVHEGGSSTDAVREQALVWYLRSLFLYVDRFHGRAFGLLYRAVFKPLFLLRLPLDALRDAAGLLLFEKREKADELRAAARFLRSGMWTFLAS